MPPLKVGSEWGVRLPERYSLNLFPFRVWIEIRKANTEHSFDVSSMGFFVFSCASVVHHLAI